MTNYHCRLCGASWSAPVTTCPAGCDDPRVNTVHVRPVADAIEHATNGDDCPCGPHVEAVFRADGSNGWLVTHRRLAPDERLTGWQWPAATAPTLTRSKTGSQRVSAPRAPSRWSRTLASARTAIARAARSAGRWSTAKSRASSTTDASRGGA